MREDEDDGGDVGEKALGVDNVGFLDDGVFVETGVGEEKKSGLEELADGGEFI